MTFLISLFLLAAPVFAQQDYAAIKRIDVNNVMNEITLNSSGNLNLSVRQEKNIFNALKKSSKQFDKAMKSYEKNLKEEKKWHQKTEEDLKIMKELSESVNDLIVEAGHLDDAQKARFAAFLAEKAKAEDSALYSKEAVPDAAAPAAAEDSSSPALSETAPVSEEAKTVSEKKKRVVLKKKNRRKTVSGNANLVPAGSKGGIKPKVSRKTENDLPSSVVPMPGVSSDGQKTIPAKPKTSAVPSL